MKSEQISSGQNGPYTDSVYEWNINAEKGESDKEVLDWCKSNLRNSSYEHEEWSKKKENNMGVYFAGYYEFLSKGNGSYLYRVVEPYCD